MRALYQAILRLYPAKYQALFAAEMTATFDQAAAHCCRRGRFALLSFAIRESGGLLRGLAGEWFAKWTARRSYLSQRESLTDVQRCIRSMEQAIANHDFVRARFYSIALDRLQRRS
jgi:hypothetical protein